MTPTVTNGCRKPRCCGGFARKVPKISVIVEYVFEAANGEIESDVKNEVRDCVVSQPVRSNCRTLTYVAVTSQKIKLCFDSNCTLGKEAIRMCENPLIPIASVP
jgi:hypothetical protein